MLSVVIRDETPDDVAAITKVIREAFAAHSNGSPIEHLIVDALRLAGALSVSLVAERDWCVVGHVAFSPVTIADGSTGWCSRAISP
jgi:putative acetyltransferase